MEEKKKSKAPLIILIVVLFLIAVAGSSFGGYLFGKNDGDKEVKKKEIECSKKVEEAKKEEKSKCEKGECDPCEADKCEKEKPRCYGTYTQDGTDGKTKWILKDDGAFSIEGQETFGVFYIEDNTIIFVESKHTTGPKDKDPSYTNPKAYLISEDCKKITLSSGEVGAGLTKQD